MDVGVQVACVNRLADKLAYNYVYTERRFLLIFYADSARSLGEVFQVGCHIKEENTCCGREIGSNNPPGYHGDKHFTVASLDFPERERKGKARCEH